MIPHDPIEDDTKFKEQFAAASEEAHLQLKDHPRKGEMGFCHVYWAVKKEILKRRYSIDWRTPVEMDDDRLTFYD